MSITVKARTQDLLDQMGSKMYRQAYDSGQSLSAWLEEQDSSTEYKDGLDTFGRMLKLSDIRTRSIPEKGIFASEVSAFDKNDQTRALLHEHFARVYRAARYQRRAPGMYSSTDEADGSILRPYADASSIRVDKKIEPAIPLSELVAIETPIDADTYRAYYIKDEPSKASMKRVAEGAAVPFVKLEGGSNVISLLKYGRGLEISYEMLRRMRLNVLEFHIQRMAAMAEMDKIEAAMSVMINGDGNSNGAEVINASSLDSASTGGTLTLPAYLRFKMAFKSPYMVTTMLGQELPILKVMLVNTGSANIPLATIRQQLGVGGFTTINRNSGDGIRLGYDDNAPSNKLLGFDNRMALEHVTEVGANITEVDKWINRQTEYLVMTEIDGFAILDKNATKILNLA